MAATNMVGHTPKGNISVAHVRNASNILNILQITNLCTILVNKFIVSFPLAIKGTKVSQQWSIILGLTPSLCLSVNGVTL